MSTPTSGSPSNSGAPCHTNCPVECVGSTFTVTSISESPFECPSVPETLTICSASQVEPETFPRIPEIGLMFLFVLVSDRISVIP